MASWNGRVLLATFTASSSVACSFFTNCGNCSNRHSCKDCLPLSNRTQQANTLANHYEQIRSQRGTGRAIIALARKFLGIMYRTLKKKVPSKTE
jgi:hypothetical protein